MAVFAMLVVPRNAVVGEGTSMKTGTVVCMLALAARAAAAADAESNVEQLVYRPSTAMPAAKAAGRRAAKQDPVVAWVGHPVRIETVDHGLYVGTLQSAGADVLVLDIALPSRALRYSMPRAAVAGVQPLEEAAP